MKIISGLDDFLYEKDGSNDIAVENIRGLIEVVENDFTPVFKDISFTYTDPSNNPANVTPALSTKNVSGDEFKSFSDAANNDVKLHEEVFQDFGTGGYSMPTVGVTLDTFIDTSSMPGNSVTDTIRIRLIEGDDEIQNSMERGIEAVFDIDRSGNGSSETWLSKAGEKIDISYSLELKLNDLLTSFESNSSVTIPKPKEGEDFHLTVSFVDDNNNDDIILSGDFSVI